MRLVVALLLAVVLVGCGGEGATKRDEHPTSTAAAAKAPPARARYVARADAVCADAATRAASVAESADRLRAAEQTASNDELARLAAEHYRNVLRFAEGFRDEFRAIEPPKEDRERIDELNRVNDEAIAELRSIVAALEDGDTSNDLFAGYGHAMQTASHLAEAYGFEVCSRVDSG